MEYKIFWFFGSLLLFSTTCPGSYGLVVPIQGEDLVKVAEIETPSSLGKDEQPLITSVIAEPVLDSVEVKSVSHPVPIVDSLAVESHESQVVPHKVEHQVLDIPVVLEVKKRDEEEEERRPNSESSVKPEEEPVAEQIEGVSEGEEGFEPVVIILTLEPGQFGVYRTAEGKLVKVVDAAEKPISIESEVPREKCFSYFFPPSPSNNQQGVNNPESPVREANPNPNIDTSQYQIQSPQPLLPGQPLSASTVYFPRETFGLRKSQSPQQTPYILVPARNMPRPLLLKSHLGSPTLGHPAPVNPNINSFVPVDSDPHGKSDAPTPAHQEKKKNVAAAPAKKSESEIWNVDAQLHSPFRPLEGRSGMRKRTMGRPGGIKRTATTTSNKNNNMGRWFWNSGYDYPSYEYDYDVYDVYDTYDYDYYNPQYQQYQYYPYYRMA